MTITISLADWQTQKTAASAIRNQVFIVEQNVPPDIEMDDMDAHCIHAIALDDNGVAIGTGRLLPDGHIGRMAVLASARGQGVGGLILKSLMQAAKQRGDTCVVLNAQVHAEEFYTAYGFVAVGKSFMEAGIAHIEMAHTFK
jgi:predicted GNAT family N-acyltransferase